MRSTRRAGLERRFLVLGGNSFKIQGLLETAKSKIPVLDRFSEIRSMLDWPANNRTAYEDLFGWMEEQEPWRLA